MLHLHTDSNLLVTGSTGLIGGEIVRRLLDCGHRGKIWLVIREKSGESARDRFAHRLRRVGDYRSDVPNLIPVGGDVTLPGWGLDPAHAEEITAETDIILHNAADTSFVARRETSRTNIESVEALIQLARDCRRNPLIAYMSTATNVGQVSDKCLSEDEGCQSTNQHFNDYTHSKAIGEETLRSSGLPVLTLRPSIVLPAGLPDPDFARQILWCVPLTRAFSGLPLNPISRLDLVDADFVARCTLKLLEKQGRRWDTYHLSSGQAGCWTLEEFKAILDGIYGRGRNTQLVLPTEWKLSHQREYIKSTLQKKIFRSLKFYFPFLNMNVVYDDSRVRADLGHDLPALRPLAGYLPPLLKLIRTRAALDEAARP